MPPRLAADMKLDGEIHMTRVERKHFINTMLLGSILALMAAILDQAGALDTPEHYLYDLRARHCQFFTPHPTDRIVHLDIDDESQEEIGAFPWARTKLAEMTDEIHLAGATALSYDILFSEPQELRYQPREDGTFRSISDDAIFADAIHRAGNVVLPVSVDPEAARWTPLEQAVIDLLSKDLELSDSEVTARLEGSPFDRPGLKDAVSDVVVRARDTAFFNRISAAMEQGVYDLPGLTALLTPRTNAAQEHTGPRVVLEQVYPRASSIRVILNRCVLTPADAPPLLRADAENAVSLPILTTAARFSASALFLPDRDGIVRRCPLFVNYRGHLMPHMALLNACAYLGVDPKSIRIAADAVDLPLPQGGDISIPVSTMHSETFGEAGLFMEIPWIGKKDWKTMYDAPEYVDSKQHLPLKAVWAICQNLHDIQHNCDLTDAALFSASQTFPSMEKAAALLAKPTTQRTAPERWAAVDDALDTMSALADIPALEKVNPNQLKPDDLMFLSTYRALHQVKAHDDALAAEVQRRRSELHAQLNGRTVLVGWTATGRTDNWRTPIHALCPGSVIQGFIFNGIVTGNLLRDAPRWIVLLVTLIAGLIVTLAVARLSTEMAMLATVTVMISYAALNGIVLFSRYRWVVGAAAPLLAAALCWVTLTVFRYLAETAERKRIESRFRSYVDPKLVNYVKDHPESVHLDGQVKDMTVVFTDLQGFTTIAEMLRERTVPMLNEYMSLMMPVIRDNGGTWNKFLGDGIMFFFNAPDNRPDHSRDAVNTVIQMQKAMTGFNQKLTAQNLPKCAMRAGVCSGPMVVGDAGSIYGLHRASDYTVLGDEVNLAARLESANKAFGSKILMNQRTADCCGNQFLLRPMGTLRVVGKTQGVLTFEALARLDEATDSQCILAALSATVVEHYRLADFVACLKCAEELEQQFGSTKFEKLYIDLCKRHIEHPPEGAFDATISLTDK